MSRRRDADVPQPGIDRPAADGAGRNACIGPPSIPELPPAVRPREKLLSRGAASLADRDLLAVIIGGGTAGDNVLRLAGRLLRRHGVGGLLRRTEREWLQDRGIGPARACRLVAAFELARRAAEKENGAGPPPVSTPAQAHALLRDLGRLRKEHLVALYLDAQNRLIARETLSVGSLNTTRTHPREIFEPALRHLAASFILAHNHPSGSLTPSRDDVAFTRAVLRAAEIMDFGFLDHLVIAGRGHTSLRESGLMERPGGAAW